MAGQLLQKIAQDTKGRVDLKLIVLFIPVAYFSFLFHEAGHWTVGEILGNSMTYSLNNVSPQSGGYLHQGQSVWVTLGGPAFTALLALIFLLIIEKYKALWAYSIVFFQFFSRLFSIVFGGYAKQDEARAALEAGVNYYTFAILVLAMLLLMVWRGSIILKLNYKSNWYFFTVSVICELLVIGTNKLI